MIKSIKVPNFTYTVSEQPLALVDDEMYGVTSRDNLSIQIDLGLPEQLKKQTLVHELLHALEINSSIKYCSEVQIEQLSHGLLFVLRNNPEFVRYLLDDSAKE